MKKKLLILFIGIGSATSVIAQDFAPKSINLVGGKQFTNFLFKNSNNEKDKTLQYQMYNAFGVNAEFTSDVHTIRPEFMLRQAGAKTSVNETNITWKMNYFNFNIAYLYNVLQNDKFEIQPGIGIGVGYMLNGEQVIGEKRLSIVDEGSMNQFEFGVHGLVNARANLTEMLFLSLEYRFGMGVNHIETDVNDQKTRNIYHGALLGIGIRLN